MNPKTEQTFSGVLEREDGRYVLKSGGITAQLEPVPGSAEALARRVGDVVRIAGRQTAARVDQAKLAADTEPQAEAAADPAYARFAAVFAAIDAKGAALLAKPNVVGMRPGFRRVAGRLTGEPAVVVTVRRKLPPEELGAGEDLPRTVADLPVDVVVASPLETLSAGARGAGGPAAAAAAGMPAVEATAIWRAVLSGSVMPEAAEAAQQIGYKKPKTVKLDASKVRDVLCHIGPDAGWPTLRAFLQDTQSQLTVTMYELTADYIVKELTALGHDTPKAKMALVLQENANETASV